MKFSDVSFIWKSLAKIFPGNQIGQVVQVLIAFESKRIQLRDRQGSVPSIDVSYFAGKKCRLTTSHVQVGPEWNGTVLKMFFVHNLKSLAWERMIKPSCHIPCPRAVSIFRCAFKELTLMLLIMFMYAIMEIAFICGSSVISIGSYKEYWVQEKGWIGKGLLIVRPPTG